jgi:chorismate dehydratase
LAGARVGVIAEAVTAPKLLEVLLKLKYGVPPAEYVPLRPQEYDAFLLIGNQALRQRRGARGFPHRYDLGQEWNSWTGLPFVFSQWVARNDMDSKELALLEDTLYVGLEDGVDALYHLNEPKDELLMLPRDVVNHLQGVRYFMGLSEQKGLNTFREYLKQLDQ